MPTELMTVLAQSPAPEQTQVPTRTALLFDATPVPGYSLVDVQCFLDDVPVLDENWQFVRPEFEGVLYLTPSLVALKVVPRRAFSEGTAVSVRVVLGLRSNINEETSHTVSWMFHTAQRVTPLRDATLQQTPLDQASPVGAVELFRQALLDALRPPDTQAATPVLLFYAVQQSALASLGSGLPRASQLAIETRHLLPRDLVSPVDAAAKLERVAVFWPALQQTLVQSGQLSPELSELLDRAWRAESPMDRLGAAAAALLYALLPAT